MRYLNLFLIIAFVSCRSHEARPSQNLKQPKDITHYDGNAIVFFNAKLSGARLYFVEVNEKDSDVFKINDINKYLESSLTIQVYFGHEILLLLMNQNSKPLLMRHICSMPYDSMYYAKVYLSYANYNEKILYGYNKNGQIERNSDRDSCNSKFIESTDSSVIRKFHIYNR